MMSWKLQEPVLPLEKKKQKTFERAFTVRINYFGNLESGQTLGIYRGLLNEVRSW